MTSTTFYDFMLSKDGTMYRMDRLTGRTWYNCRNQWILIFEPKESK